MAGTRTCRSSHHNLTLGDQDELVEGPPEAPTKGRNTSIPSLTIF